MSAARRCERHLTDLLLLIQRLVYPIYQLGAGTLDRYILLLRAQPPPWDMKVNLEQQPHRSDLIVSFEHWL